MDSNKEQAALDESITYLVTWKHLDCRELLQLGISLEFVDDFLLSEVTRRVGDSDAARVVRNLFVFLSFLAKEAHATAEM